MVGLTRPAKPVTIGTILGNLVRMTRFDGLAIGVLVMAVVLWFHPFFINGEMLLPPNANSSYPWVATDAAYPAHPQGSWDTTRENYITWALHKQYLEAGEAPFWQPYFVGGNPLLANQFSIPYSPFKALNLIFSAPVAWSWAVVLKSLMAGVFAYASLRALSRGYTASLVGALAWMLSWPLAHQTETTYNEGVALLSVVLFSLIKTYQAVDALPHADNRGAAWGRVWRYGLGATLAAGFQMLSGNVQMPIYGFLLLMALALFWSWQRQGNPLRRLAPLWILIAVYVGGTFIGAVQLWSSFELFGESIRGAAQTHTNKGIEPYTFLSLLNPWLYFWRNFEFPDLQIQYWLNYRWNPYIGILPAFAALIALRFARQTFARATAVFVLVVLGIMHLLYLRPIFNVVSQLPGYDVLEQTRFLIIMPLPMAILGAYGVDWLLDHGQERWRAWRPFWVLLGVGVALVVCLLLAAMSFFDGELDAAATLGDSFAAQEVQVGTQVIADYYRVDNPLFVVSMVSLLGWLGILWAYGTGRLSRQMLQPILVGAVLVEMVIFAQVNVASTPREKVYPVTPALEWLQSQDGLFRIHAAPNTLLEGRDTGDYSTYRDNHSWFIAGRTPILTPNTAALFGLQDIRGYESVYTLRYSTYMAAMEGFEQPFSAQVIPETITHPMLDALNVRYILAIEPLDDPALALVYEGEILIYENLNALPRVMLYDAEQITRLPDDDAILAALTAPDYDPRQAVFVTGGEVSIGRQVDAGRAPGVAAITDYRPNRVTVEIQAPHDQLLVLADVYYPGWQATLNGTDDLDIIPVNTILRGVVVPAGNHTLTFSYNPPLLRLTWWLSLISVGLVLFGLVGLLLIQRI